MAIKQKPWYLALFTFFLNCLRTALTKLDFGITGRPRQFEKFDRKILIQTDRRTEKIHFYWRYRWQPKCFNHPYNIARPARWTHSLRSSTPGRTRPQWRHTRSTLEGTGSSMAWWLAARSPSNTSTWRQSRWRESRSQCGCSCVIPGTKYMHIIYLRKKSLKWTGWL